MESAVPDNRDSASSAGAVTRQLEIVRSCTKHWSKLARI